MLPLHLIVSVSSRSYILSYLKTVQTESGLEYVSVSSRSYILSYYEFAFTIITFSLLVSVSSRSYILSYVKWQSGIKQVL